MIDKLVQKGHFSEVIELPSHWREYCLNKDYDSLDRIAKLSLQQNEFLYLKIKSMAKSFFEKSEMSFEHILSLRIGPQDEELDGIWHDDGTRHLAFSLSLNLDYQSIVGGDLLMRKKESPDQILKIKPRPFGTLTVFCTGMDGWEHKTSLVTNGTRLVLAGWLS